MSIDLLHGRPLCSRDQDFALGDLWQQSQHIHKRAPGGGDVLVVSTSANKTYCAHSLIPQKLGRPCWRGFRAQIQDQRLPAKLVKERTKLILVRCGDDKDAILVFGRVQVVKERRDYGNCALGHESANGWEKTQNTQLPKRSYKMFFWLPKVKSSRTRIRRKRIIFAEFPTSYLLTLRK